MTSTAIDPQLFEFTEWAVEISQERQRIHEIEMEKRRRAEQARLQVQERINTGQRDSITATREAYDVELALHQFGYMQKGSKWLSPNSSNKTPGVTVKEGKWFSHHDSDSMIGQPAQNGGIWGDAFDLIVHYQYGGNFDAAVKALGDQYTIQDPVKGDVVTINKFNQRQHMRQREQQPTRDQRKASPKKITRNDTAILEKARQILNSQEPCGEFDTKQLPELLKDIVRAQTLETDASPTMLIQSLLCTISAMVGRNAYIPETEYFQRLFPVIWCCSIAKSGSFKTTALNKGASIAFQVQSELSKKIKILEGSKGSDKKQNKLIDDEISTLLVQNPILSTRATAEALTEELSTGQAGQIIASELGAWLANMSSNHSGTIKQLLTDFYDVPPFYSYRTRTNGRLEVEHPFITVNGVSTLEWLHSNLAWEHRCNSPPFSWKTYTGKE